MFCRERHAKQLITSARPSNCRPCSLFCVDWSRVNERESTHTHNAKMKLLWPRSLCAHVTRICLHQKRAACQTAALHHKLQICLLSDNNSPLVRSIFRYSAFCTCRNLLCICKCDSYDNEKCSQSAPLPRSNSR